MTTLQIISISIGIGTSIAGSIIALVNLGIKVGTITHKIESLEVSNKEWNENNREKINEMTQSNNEQNTSIKLLEQKLDTMCDGIKDVKNTLNDITKYIKESEADKVKIESRLDYLEKSKK